MSCRAVLLTLLALIVTSSLASTAAGQSSDRATENVFLITLDGLRWEELFAGADSTLLHDERYVDDVDGLRERFWRDTPAARRAALMPFFWSTIAQEGQLYGDRTRGCTVDATNNMLFSYPGYNEILTGAADDDRIDSNAKRPNPNVTVLEAVNRQDGFRDRVAAFGSWDVFPYIINEDRSGVPVNAGFETATGDLTQKERFLNELQPQIPSPWGAVRLDAFTHHYAVEHLKQHRPRLLYVAYGETDDFGHDGEYGQYLRAARRTDAFIEALWTFAQSDPQYRNTTTLLITTDHGRGSGDAWTGHGTDVDGARAIWMVALGPDTAPRGPVSTDCALYQNQVAATVTALLGLDVEFEPDAGPAVETILE
jgi:hypothetical protein